MKAFTRGVFVLGMVVSLGACADMEALNLRLDALEEKVNEALQASSSAKVDAATALLISEELEAK